MILKLVLVFWAVHRPSMVSVAASDEVWPRVRKFLAGYASGCSLVLVGHPFDTIKVRMQSEGTKGRFNGVFDCVKTTIKNEGIRGMYKGMGTPLFLTGIINSILFGTQYNICAEMVKRRGGRPDESATITETMKAAMISGALISVLVTPMEGIKARLQVQYTNGTGYNGPFDCAKQVYTKLGIRKGIYRGWFPVVVSRMSNWSYFGSYAFITSYLAQVVQKPGEKGPLPAWAAVVAGGTAGICYWLSCYPMDVVKNKIMASPDSKTPTYANTRDAFKQIWRADGLRGFFVGFTPCVWRAFPANAAAFLGFELAMRVLPQ